MKVTCIDSSGTAFTHDDHEIPMSTFLTVGKVYLAEKVPNSDELQLIDNTDNIGTFSAERFKPIK
jgi:hypothetical protein